MRQLVHATWLAFKELRADPRSTLCFVFAFVGAALPLLLLLALKEGAVGALVDDLIEDPRNREVIAVGADSYDRAFFDEVAASDNIAFLTPDTRNISARFALARSLKGREAITGLALLPTAAGDPLYPAPAPDWAAREIVLSRDAARELKLDTGDRLEGVVERRVGVRTEYGRVELTVAQIAPPESLGGRYALAPLPLLESVENFLDDRSVGVDDWLEARPRERFASFRAYAPSIYEVEALRDEMVALGARARIRSEEAALMLRLDRLLNWLYALIAGCGAGGFFLALAGSLRANLERQRGAIGLLRLMGASGGLRAWISLAQSVAIVALGLIVTLLGFFILSNVVNFMLTDLAVGGGIIRLDASALVAFVAASLSCAALAAIWSARESARIAAEEGFRSG